MLFFSSSLVGSSLFHDCWPHFLSCCSPNSSPPFKLTTSYSGPEVVGPSDATLPQWEATKCCLSYSHYVDCVDRARYGGCFGCANMLVVANMLIHVHTLTPYGNHSSCVGVVSDTTLGANVLTCFFGSYDGVFCKFELFCMLLQWKICKGLRCSSQNSVPLKYE